MPIEALRESFLIGFVAASDHYESGFRQARRLSILEAEEAVESPLVLRPHFKPATHVAMHGLVAKPSAELRRGACCDCVDCRQDFGFDFVWH